jgi:ribosome maturation factor RimP
VLTTDGKKLSGILSAANSEFFSLEIEKSVKPEGAKRKMTITETLDFNYNDIKYTKYIIRFK